MALNVVGLASGRNAYRTRMGRCGKSPFMYSLVQEVPLGPGTGLPSLPSKPGVLQDPDQVLLKTLKVTETKNKRLPQPRDQAEAVSVRWADPDWILNQTGELPNKSGI